MKRIHRRFKRGFTLIELIVVMAVIAILVLLAAPRVMGRTEEATQTKTGYNTKVLSDVAEVYHAEHETYPVLEGAYPLPYGVLGVGGVDALYPLDMEKLKPVVTHHTSTTSQFGMALSGQNEGRVYPLSGMDAEVPQHRFGLLSEESLLSRGIYGFEVPDAGPIQLKTDATQWAGMWFLNDKKLNLKPNTTYALSYSYRKVGGTLVTFGGHVGEELTKHARVYVDGVLREEPYQHSESAFVADNGLVHDVLVTFKTEQSLSTVDTSIANTIWIQPNRGQEEPVTVLIDDLLLVEVVEP